MQVRNTTLLRAALTSVLRHDHSNLEEHFAESLAQADAEQLSNLLGDYLISSDNQWKAETLELLDQVWKEDAVSAKNRKNRIHVDDLTSIAQVQNTNIILWKGDITQLATSSNDLAVVNAANDQGLGCFQPSHKCIDNVIHRSAGPRLRSACRDAIKERGNTPLFAGSKPIVTPAFHLPSDFVIHVTGPQIAGGSAPSIRDRELLAASYRNVLDLAAATKGIGTVAIPCISTGLFGFPQEEAAKIALSTVKEWLERHPNSLIDAVVFNVFTTKDHQLYEQEVESHFRIPNESSLTLPTTIAATNPSPVRSQRTQTMSLAKAWLDQADAVLICAGAGMSVKEGEMVYTNPADFSKHYPWFASKWGYQTSYECMGLSSDRRVPETAKWALHAKHMDNMRWTFTPNDGYQHLLDIVRDKDYFVLTSNVDACFERSGFDPNRIYTPQGEWTYLQCTNSACTSQQDSVVYPSRPYLDQILPTIDTENGFIPEDMVPNCPRCGTVMFGNVRGGGWFLHHAKYEQQNAALQQWMEKQIHSNKNVVVLEIGVGFNTPTVTRFPMEAFVREIQMRNGSGRLIRINPTEAHVPEDLTAISIAEGWQVLEEIKRADANNLPISLEDLKTLQYDQGLMVPHLQSTEYFRRRLGHFDWRHFLDQLRDDDHH